MIPVVQHAALLPLPPPGYTLKPLGKLLLTSSLPTTTQTPVSLSADYKSHMPTMILVTIMAVCMFVVLARLYKLIKKCCKPPKTSHPIISLHFLAKSQTVTIKLTTIRESMNLLLFHSAPIASNFRFLQGSTLAIDWSEHLRLHCEKKPINLALPKTLKLPRHTFGTLRRLVALQPTIPTRIYVTSDYHLPMALSHYRPLEHQHLSCEASAPPMSREALATSSAECSNPLSLETSPILPEVSPLYPDLTRTTILDPILKALDLDHQQCSWCPSTPDS
jgi:hypothetical protein